MQAVCKFCGQVILADVPDGASRAECEHIGTMECGCEEAHKYQMRQERAAKAKIKLDAMLLCDNGDSGIKAVPAPIIELL